MQGWAATREGDGESVSASKGGAAAVVALYLLQDREEGIAEPKALTFPEHLPGAPCFQKTVDGPCPSLSKKKKLVQLKKFDQQSHGTIEVHERG